MEGVWVTDHTGQRRFMPTQAVPGVASHLPQAYHQVQYQQYPNPYDVAIPPRPAMPGQHRQTQQQHMNMPPFQDYLPPQQRQHAQFQEGPVKQVYSHSQQQLAPSYVQQYHQHTHQPLSQQPARQPQQQQQQNSTPQRQSQEQHLSKREQHQHPTPQRRAVSFAESAPRHEVLPAPPQAPAQPLRPQKQGPALQAALPAKTQPLPRPATTSIPQPATIPVAKPVITPDLPVDYRLLLLQLSDKYITEARSLTGACAYDQEDADPERYFELMGAGMTCLATVLKQQNWMMGMPPRQAAMLRLRYATLLYEETEDDEQLGEFLSKSITFCDRNKLIDLKYSFQHLCARHMFGLNSKMGLSFLENVMKDLTAYQHTAWVFAFRFLRVSLHMKLATPHDLQAALSDLKAIADLSRKKQERAVSVLAAVLQAMIHLRTRDPEAINSAQTAIATARAQQLDETSNSVPQLASLILLLDLACSLDPYDVHSVKEKMRVMQLYLDGTANLGDWTNDGALSIPIMRTDIEGLDESGGIFIRDETGTFLQFTWLSRSNVYMVGMLFSCITAYPKAHDGSGKAETYLKGGLRMAGDTYQIDEACSTDSLLQAYSRSRHCKLLQSWLMLHATFTKCERFNWTGAIEGIEELSEALSFPGLHPPDELLRFTIYLKGTIHQSLGDLDVALNCYNNPLLALANPAITSRNSYTSSAHEMLAILAALNSCLITHAPSHSQHQSIESICEHLSNCFDNIKNDSSGAQTLATSNPNLAAAWGIIHAIRTAPTTLPRSSHEQATAPSPSTQHNKGILLTKSHLQRSIHLARSVENKHLMAVLMTLISSFFFTGQIGEHAYGAANGARATAKTAGLRVWQMLAADMAAQRLEGDGKKEEADRMWREVEGLERILPGGLFERDGAL